MERESIRPHVPLLVPLSYVTNLTHMSFSLDRVSTAEVDILQGRRYFCCTSHSNPLDLQNPLRFVLDQEGFDVFVAHRVQKLWVYREL